MRGEWFIPHFFFNLLRLKYNLKEISLVLFERNRHVFIWKKNTNTTRRMGKLIGTNWHKFFKEIGLFYLKEIGIIRIMSAPQANYSYYSNFFPFIFFGASQLFLLFQFLSVYSSRRKPIIRIIPISFRSFFSAQVNYSYYSNFFQIILWHFIQPQQVDWICAH